MQSQEGLELTRGAQFVSQNYRLRRRLGTTLQYTLLGLLLFFAIAASRKILRWVTGRPVRSRWHW